MSSRTIHAPGLNGILERANQAYRRRDDDEFLALMREAVRLAPTRADIRVCLANELVHLGRTGEALAVFEEASALLPNDPELLMRLAHWRKHAGNDGGAWDAHRRLAEIRPEFAADLWRVWGVVDAWLSRPVSDRLPDPPAEPLPTAVVLLGLKLAPDGTPRPALIDRIEKALEALAAYPDSIVVATGGIPQSGRTETEVMRDWLLERGLPPERIHEEGCARDVVENILYSRYILDAERIRRVVAVTAANNVRRTGAALDIIAWTRGCSWSSTVTAASGGSFAAFADDGRDRGKLFRDALRAYGLPTMTAYPHLAER